MAYKIVNDDSLTSVANAIRVKGEISGTLEFPDGFVSAIQNLSPSPTLQTKTKTYTPTTSQQTESVVADSGYDGLDEVDVTVNAIPSQYKDTTDATATADKILQGYTAYANGQKLVGTASGGITPSGTIQITQNGQVDVTQYATADVNVSGGGASNFVTGTFTTASTRNSTGTFTIPYTGNGYPIALMVFVKGGVYNATSSGNSQWYQSTNIYDVGQYCMVKSATPIEPNYGGNYNQGAVSIIYKNSSTISTTYSGTRSVSASTYGNETDSAQTGVLCIRFKGNGTTVSYFIGNLSSSARGLAPNTEYEYIAVYSE